MSNRSPEGAQVMMIATVSTFIARHRLLDAGALHLVALSGGADSVALLLVMQELGYRIEAVHCNFRLRGDEADRDEAFCERLCRERQVPLHHVHFDTRAYAEGHHVSVEMAARALRYRYFEQLRQALQAADILVAHHRDDSVETFLLNLVRGTGLHGLTGIKPRSGHVVRPLLCVSRREIEDWLARRHQSFVTDSTNLVDDVQRNRLRLDVLPVLEAVNPRARQHIADAMRRLGAVERVFDEAVGDARRRMVATTADGDMAVGLPELMATAAPEALLWEWLEPYGFNSAQVDGMMAARGHTGSGWTSPTHAAAIAGCQLIVAAKASLAPVELRVPEPGVYVVAAGDRTLRLRTTVEAGGWEQVSRQPAVATLDAGLVGFPLTLRTVRQGDRFQPFGMAATRLVSDYLTDRHRNVFQKRRQLVVADATGRIVWLVGERTDGRAAVGRATQSILRMQVEKA